MASQATGLVGNVDRHDDEFIISGGQKASGIVYTSKRSSTTTTTLTTITTRNNNLDDLKLNQQPQSSSSSSSLSSSLIRSADLINGNNNNDDNNNTRGKQFSATTMRMTTTTNGNELAADISDEIRAPRQLETTSTAVIGADENNANLPGEPQNRRLERQPSGAGHGKENKAKDYHQVAPIKPTTTTTTSPANSRPAKTSNNEPNINCGSRGATTNNPVAKQSANSYVTRPTSLVGIAPRQSREQNIVEESNQTKSRGDNKKKSNKMNRQRLEDQQGYYDYCQTTDFSYDLSPPGRQPAAHYEENILLFATEHSNSNGGGQFNKRPTTTNNNNGSSSGRSSSLIRRPNHSSNAVASNTCSPVQRPSRARQQVGRFVNYYPSSRQPTPTRHTSPYSFHVPLNQQVRSSMSHRSPSPMSSNYQIIGSSLAGDPLTTPMRRAGSRRSRSSRPPGQVVYQQRYGYVAPVERLEQLPPGQSRFNQTLRSRTIGHLPSMVHVSVEDNTKSKLDLTQPDEDHFEYSQQDFEEIPEKTPIISKGRSFVASEGDLLKAHVVTMRSKDLGYDNPFKPGTELSWEADLMVRLIKRGYPVQELPNLVRAAKEVATSSLLDEEKILITNNEREKKKSQSCERIGTSGVANSIGGHSAITNFNDKLHSTNKYPNKLIKTTGRNNSSKNIKDKSATLSHSGVDLSSCKQIWANSLSRAKSMPRFYSNHNSSTTTKDDSDSLDKLITSIEQEISDIRKEREGELVNEKQQQSLDGQIKSEKSSPLRSSNVGQQQQQQSNRKRLSTSNSEQQIVSKRLIKPLDSGSPKRRGQREQQQKLRPSSTQEDLAITAKKKKKPRCCRIQ